MITQGIQSLGSDAVLAIRKAVASFNGFSQDNDPYGEHDFGSFKYQGDKIFWKINCHDKSLQCGSPSAQLLQKQTVPMHGYGLICDV